MEKLPLFTRKQPMKTRNQPLPYSSPPRPTTFFSYFKVYDCTGHMIPSF